MKTLSITDENGKVYEFEKPDFDDYVLSYIVDDCIIGHVIDDGQLVTLKIYKDGHAYGYQTKGKYDLTPIEKHWHEDKSNFPALIVNIETGIFHKAIKKIDGRIQVKGNSILEIESIRLATKEEIQSLYYEGKQHDS